MCSSWHGTYRRGPVLHTPAATLVLFLCALGSPAPAAPREGTPGPIRVLDFDTRTDANQLDMFTTNLGSFAWDLSTGDPGLIYPRGTARTAVFAAGLWMGAQVGGNTRVTVAEYSWEYAPGKVLSPTEWADPYDPSYRVYKILPGDTPDSNPDYAQWPAGDGAPVDENGQPRHFGAQTLWSVYNDLDPSWHRNNAGGTAPLGVEIQHTTFARDDPGPAQTTIFMEWKIVNKGSSRLENAYMAVWSDPDLGGAQDDLVGCDTLLDLGYCYNATNSDGQYGSSPPAVGVALIQGPIVPSPGDEAYVSGRTVRDYRNLPMTSFVKYISGTDPQSPSESYNYIRGLQRDGSPVIDPANGEVTTYMVSGDPVSGEGWLDTNPSDRRMMLSAGPFTMAPGDTQVVVAAVCVGHGLDRLASVTELKSHAAALPLLFRSVMGDELGACCLTGGACIQTSAAECLEGEFFLRLGCDSNPCQAATGACCFDDGTCLVLPPGLCAGRYQGDGTVCSPGSCPVYGPSAACCLGSGLCQMLPEYDCLAIGGTYAAGETCVPEPPGGLPGWQRNDLDRPMIDEVASAGGWPVPPDGHGGPGNAVWHSRNSSDEWHMSAGGGDGSEARFTRNGYDLQNLTDRDLILKWDHRPDNLGWWVFDSGEVGAIPFGLYERDPCTGEETRLIPVLFSGGGSAGIYDISAQTPDPFTGQPATDWGYAYRFDPEIATYEEFVQDAQDGDIDTDPITVELFARMILGSEIPTLPAAGTVIQFTTKKSGIQAGSGFSGAVPLSWPEPEGGLACLGTPWYDIYRDGVLRGATDRTDFLDEGGLVSGETYTYRIRTRNPLTGETSEPSVPVSAVPISGGHVVDCGMATALPAIDGSVDPEEWANATVVPAACPTAGPAASLGLMNSGGFLYLALRDEVAVDDFRIYIDANGNGVFDSDAFEGVVWLDHGVRRFTRLAGDYPDITVIDEITNPTGCTASPAPTRRRSG